VSGLAPGRVVLEDATRSFELASQRAHTLKDVFVRSRRRGAGSVPALAGVSLRIDPGEAVGVVGRNGAGKTSTLRCLAGIVPLDSGRAECGGKVASLLELGAGFGADFTGRENVYLSGALHGFGREEIEERMERIVEFSELGEFMDVAVKAYSSGMFLRLGFSIAAFLDADVMLIDEILAVGDESFQRKCLGRIAQRMEAGATLVLVSHDPSAIERVCRRVVVLDGGKVAYDGAVAEGLLFYHRLLGADAPRSKSLRHAGEEGLQVLELELLDADGRPRHAFRTGEPLRVQMRVASAEGADRAVAALEVRDERGQTAFRTDATLGRLEGEVTVAFDVPRLNLLGGDYDVAVGAFPQDAPPGERLDRVGRFSVAMTLEGEGIADLRGAWTVAGRPAAEELLR
jgi:ABC-type polysaccharide/polyol phosphate transport system ATPase subunit